MSSCWTLIGDTVNDKPNSHVLLPCVSICAVYDHSDMDKFEKKINKILNGAKRAADKCAAKTPGHQPSNVRKKFPRLPLSIKRELEKMDKMGPLTNRAKCKCDCCPHTF